MRDGSIFEFTGTKLEEFPLPATLPLAWGRRLDSLAQALRRNHPAAVCDCGSPVQRRALDRRRAEYERIRAEMIAAQEELDWQCYRLYGLIDEDLTYPGDDLPGLGWGSVPSRSCLPARWRRARRSDEWFTRHGSTPITEIPAALAARHTATSCSDGST